MDLGPPASLAAVLQTAPWRKEMTCGAIGNGGKHRSIAARFRRGPPPRRGPYAPVQPTSRPRRGRTGRRCKSADAGVARSQCDGTKTGTLSADRAAGSLRLSRGATPRRSLHRACRNDRLTGPASRDNFRTDLRAAGTMHKHRRSGARASPASPEPMNTGYGNQRLGPCSSVPGPGQAGRPGMTARF